MNKEKRRDNIEKLEGLMQHSMNRKLDANSIVFINKWIEEERKDAQNRLLKELIIIKHSLSFYKTEEDILKIENLCTKLISKINKLKE